jgi:hypothetical protein
MCARIEAPQDLHAFGPVIFCHLSSGFVKVGS